MIPRDTAKITGGALNPAIKKLVTNVRKVIVGKDSVIRLALACLFARGHLLIEDVPGIGKTMLARAISRSLAVKFRRIQFTPDLLPSDVTGVSVFHPSRQTFEFHEGPVFTNVLLSDEINRASPRTQSSLLECMEELQVTVDGTTHHLEHPFFVVATQNPVELDGTYPLPEAQLDRFLMRIEVGYPEIDQEMKILDDQRISHPIEDLDPVLGLQDLTKIQNAVRGLHVSEEIRRYIVSLVDATRDNSDIRLGISPRGGLALMRASQALSFLDGHSFVTPDAVKAVAPAVLSHRMILNPHREHTGLNKATVVRAILADVPVPTLPHEKLASQG